MDACLYRNRWEKGETADFINCPLDKATYDAFAAKLREAESVEPRRLKKRTFRRLPPGGEMARRGWKLHYGPMRP